ncbi:MAG: toxin-antitoxin system HicB family antitoxin [Oxalobacteraceae bacterium]|nr:MAG: toxin-antitoxin system HicB family antitoxin [Oxalobacteraceae bacterium]
MARTASIGIRVEPELKARAEAAAKADGRTLAQWIERLIVSAVGKPTPVGD